MFIKTIKRKKTSFFHHPFVCWKQTSATTRNTSSPTPILFPTERNPRVASSSQPQHPNPVQPTPTRQPTAERETIEPTDTDHEELAGLICVAMERRPWLRPAVPLTPSLKGLGFETGEGYLVAPRTRQGLVRFYKGYMIHGFMKESRNNNWGSMIPYPPWN